MRHRWLTTVLFALALAVQALAPIAGNVARANGFGAASASVALCLSKASGGPTDPQQAPGAAHGHRHDCALCQSLCDGVAPIAAPPLQLVAASAFWRAAEWAADARALPARRFDHARQARAPPTFS